MLKFDLDMDLLLGLLRTVSKSKILESLKGGVVHQCICRRRRLNATLNLYYFVASGVDSHAHIKHFWI